MASKKILLVEGKDDEQVLIHLCDTRGVQKPDEIKQHGSVNQLLESFPVRLKESDLEALGVILDADTDMAARWQSLRDRLNKAGYQNLPDSPCQGGTILLPPSDSLLPRVGIWIMPDNQANGILEDFLRSLVPAESPLFSHVQASVESIPAGEQRFPDLAKPKAIIHTWLAWQEKPGKPLGTAITARFLNPSVAQVDELVSWLDRLFFSR